MITTGVNMELKYGQILFEGKRLDEVANEIWAMNSTQVKELGAHLWTVCFNDNPTKVFDELWVKIGERHDYFHAERQKYFDSIIRERGGFRHGKYPYVLDVDSLPAAQAVFGDLVVAVYLPMNNLNQTSIDISETDETRYIDLDARTIVIEFVNGHRVEYSNSEWGTIALLKPTI
jgi:hypothetical protein